MDQTTNRTIPVCGWTGTRFGKPEIGACAERRRVTRAEDIIAFTEMTGDRNPLHHDEACARDSVFGRLIVQGGVTSGLLNALVAEDLPGPGSVFRRRVEVPEGSRRRREIVARAEVLGVRDDKPICTLETTI